MSKTSEDVIGWIIADLQAHRDDLARIRKEIDGRLNLLSTAQAERDAVDARLAAIDAELAALNSRLSAAKVSNVGL